MFYVGLFCFEIYLFALKRNNVCPSNCQFTSQMVATAKPRLSPSQEPETFLGFPCGCGRGSRAERQLPLLSQAHYQVAGMEMEKPGHEPVLIRDDGFAGGGFTYYTLMLASGNNFYILRKAYILAKQEIVQL